MPLVITYTHDLRGDLAVLPRLYPFLRRIEGEYAADGARVLRLDLGGSCAQEAWHCAATGGRSMLIALDGMGFHAANAMGVEPEVREKFGGGFALALVDPAHPHTIDGVRLVVPPAPSTPLPQGEGSGVRVSLTIELAPAAQTTLEPDAGGMRLRLAALDPDPQSERPAAFGVVRLESDDELGAYGVYLLPDDALPDPTIAAAVAFIDSEARFAEKRKR